MDRNIVIAAVVLAFVAVIILSSFSNQFAQHQQKIAGNLSVQTFGRVSDVGYVIYEANGSGKMTLLALKEKPRKTIFVLKDSGVGMEHFEDFVAQLYTLDSIGYETKITNPFGDVKEGVVIIPTGAMPLSFLERMEGIDSPVIYIGAKDLIISGGVKRQQWYASLPDATKSKITVIDGTLDDVFTNKKETLNDILLNLKENGWAVVNKKEINVIGADGNYTETIEMANASYVRLVWQTDELTAISDSGNLSTSGIKINATKELFPWEKMSLMFEVEKTNGTAYIVMEKNNEEKIRDKWQRVSEGNVFIKSYSLDEPGTYIIKIMDNSGVIGGGATHVKDLQISFVQNNGYDYVFSIKLDHRALKQGVVSISLNNSTKSHEYFISDGMLVVPAKLEIGKNIFHFRILGGEKDVAVENAQDELTGIYLKYGLPGLVLVILVYTVARFVRKPVYTLKVSDWSGKIRAELKVPAERAKDVFIIARRDLGISGPLTAHEYGIGLKRYVTEGAEITEGNLEQILKQLCNRGALETHGGFYQLVGEGDVKKNVLKRIIRDELIKKGVRFEAVGNKFITLHYELGFFGDRFNKRAFIVFDSEADICSALSSLNERAKATLALQRFNNKVELVTKDRLEDVL